MLFFKSKELLAPSHNHKLGDHPCQLPPTTYSIYSHLPSTSGGHLHPQHVYVPCHGDRDPCNMVNITSQHKTIFTKQTLTNVMSTEN